MFGNTNLVNNFLSIKTRYINLQSTHSLLIVSEIFVRNWNNLKYFFYLSIVVL